MMQNTIKGCLSTMYQTQNLPYRRSPLWPLELKIRFMKINISGDDQSNINSLDAVIRGDWKAMPTKQLIIETIGLSGRI